MKASTHLNKNDMSVGCIGLSIRTWHGLAFLGIQTVGQLRDVPENKLLQLRNFGKKAIREAKNALLNFGITVPWNA